MLLIIPFALLFIGLLVTVFRLIADGAWGPAAIIVLSVVAVVSGIRFYSYASRDCSSFEYAADPGCYAERHQGERDAAAAKFEQKRLGREYVKDYLREYYDKQ